MASSSVHDPKILDVLCGLAEVSLDIEVYRAVFQGRDPTVGSLAGGRWSPPQTFEALYTSRDADCAIREVLFHLRRQPIFPRQPVELHTLHVKTARTVDLSDDAVSDALKLDSSSLTSMDCQQCHEIGHAAEFLGTDSIIVKSARSDAENLVIIVGHLSEPIVTTAQKIVDWADYS